MSIGARTLPRWNRKPQKPKPSSEAPKRPRVKDLREIYKGLITLSSANRIAAMASAMQWHDNAIRYLLFKNRMADGRLNLLSKLAAARVHMVRQREDDRKEQAMMDLAESLLRNVAARLDEERRAS